MPYEKGQSGNPGGRRKIDGKIKDFAKQYTEESIEAIVEIMRNGKYEASRLAAATALLDRGWGKPAQTVIGSDDPEDAPLRLLING